MPDWFRIANEDEVPSPALLLYPERIEENLRRMVARAGGASRLRPHVKTHKLPQIVKMKLAAGITKFKAATLAEAEMTAAAGGRDILLAYQPVGPNIQRFMELIRRFPETRFMALVDNESSLAQLSAAATAAGLTLDLLVDLDVGMHRTGIAPGPDSFALYRRLARSPGLRAAGLHAYDGHLRNADHAALARDAEAAFAQVQRLQRQLEALGLAVPLIVAGGTPTFPILASHGNVEVGAGTTVLWDFGQAEVSPDLDFLHAAVLLTRVVSRPTANRLCLDLGHKAVASEMPPPRVRFFGLEDAPAVTHSEEHLVIETPRAGAFAVGTALYALPRHVCPTVALQSEVFVVRQGACVECWPVTARARRLTI